MTIRVVTAPPAEPLTLTEAKAHLRVDATTDDTLITALIVVARQYAELLTGRAFVQRTLELLLPAFPLGREEIELPMPPLQSVTSITYIDGDGTTQTVAAADYQVDIYRAPGLVKPAYGDFWPTLTRGDFNSVAIRYVAGYTPSGSPASDLDYAADPELHALKQWMKIRIATMYEYREAIIVGTIVAELKRDFIDGLLDRYVVQVF